MPPSEKIAAPYEGPGPFRTSNLSPGDRYELRRGHAVGHYLTDEHRCCGWQHQRHGHAVSIAQSDAVSIAQSDAVHFTLWHGESH